jgi:putative oxidoreductase
MVFRLGGARLVLRSGTTIKNQKEKIMTTDTNKCGKLGDAYRLWVKAVGCLQSPLLLAMRLYWGWQMFVSGRAHLSDVPAMVQRFQGWGIPHPTLNVYLSGLTECTCGLLLLVGLASRIITIPLVINFCVAYLTASRQTVLNIFNDPDAFVSDAAFLFLLTSFIVLVFGPGKFSLDWLIAKKCCKCSGTVEKT